MCQFTPPAELVLVMDETAGRRARRFLDAHWCRPHASELRPQGDLVVTELVTNAVRHGTPPAVLHLRCDGEAGVVVRVHDAEPQAPQLRDADPEALGGRGIALVDVLSAEWGVDPAPDGKAVWSRLVRGTPTG